MNKLSKRQQEILDFIKEQVVLKGYPPSVREIGQSVGLASSSTVHGHLSRLEKKALSVGTLRNRGQLKLLN